MCQTFGCFCTQKVGLITGHATYEWAKNKVIELWNTRATPQISGLKQVREVLEENGKTFRWYEELHAAKPDMDKAKRNAEFAERSEKALATLDGIIAGQVAPVPEGYKLVPIEPTVEMLMAGYNGGDITQPRTKNMYKAMLSAAPTPAQPEKLDVENLKREIERVKKERDELAVGYRYIDAVLKDVGVVDLTEEKTVWDKLSKKVRNENGNA